MNVKLILLPVDGSPHSMRAAEAAIEIAKHFGSEIVLLSCRKALGTMILGEPMFQGNVEKHVEKSEEILAPFIALLQGSGVKFSERIIPGRARDIIPEVAKAEHCDLIVMGKRGMSDIARLVVGSVTNKVLQIAQCPVLVIR